MAPRAARAASAYSAGVYHSVSPVFCETWAKGLRRATRLDQVKLVVDVAAAQYVFATRQRLGGELLRD